MDTTHRCPIRGHDHDLTMISAHTQMGTGEKAITLECPTGAYRWLWIIGHTQTIAEAPKMKRPRFGWKS